MAAAYTYQRLIDLLLVDIEFLQYLHRVTAALAGYSDEEMLYAHVLVIQAVGFADCSL